MGFPCQGVKSGSRNSNDFAQNSNSAQIILERICIQKLNWVWKGGGVQLNLSQKKIYPNFVVSEESVSEIYPKG